MFWPSLVISFSPIVKHNPKSLRHYVIASLFRNLKCRDFYFFRFLTHLRNRPHLHAMCSEIVENRFKREL